MLTILIACCCFSSDVSCLASIFRLPLKAFFFQSQSYPDPKSHGSLSLPLIYFLSTSHLLVGLADDGKYGIIKIGYLFVLFTLVSFISFSFRYSHSSPACNAAISSFILHLFYFPSISFSISLTISFSNYPRIS